MSRCPHPVLALLLACALSLSLAACGGSGEAADARTDVNALLRDTFAPGKRIESGRLDLALRIDPRGTGSARLRGPSTLSVRGPFAMGAEGRLPRFALEATFEGAGQRLGAGAVSTGEQGFVTYQGRSYELSGPVFRQLRAAYEQAQAERSGEPSLAALGIDPRRWMTDAENAGEARVGDDDVVRITGGVDVGRLLDDLDGAFERAARLGLGAGAGKAPARLTEAQKEEIRRGVQEAPRVELYTGAEDRILRRMVVDLEVRDPAETDAVAAVRLDVSVTDVDEEQAIEAPKDPRPFSELRERLGVLGALGGFGGGTPGHVPGAAALAP